jgi:carboxyl-terminal processing protease
VLSAQDAFASSKDGVDTASPLFLLVNGNTASASEIMTGALKDQGRAKIVGEKTFGKGVVQTVTPLADGSGVATTIARYETPNHVDINKKGIEVDADAGGAMCPDPYPNL